MQISTMIKIPQIFQMRSILTLVVILLSGSKVGAQMQHLHVNEFMALNATTLTDEDGDYADWIEIYNPTSETISLQDYSLSDDANEPQKWLFPDVAIASKGYLIVFASGKDRSVAGAELHANFKLSGSGEYLGFFSPTGVELSLFSPMYPVQNEDISYGYIDGGYVAFYKPTPGVENTSEGGFAIAAPQLSHKHGFYEEAFTLKITASLPAAKIYYTTDGSAPSAENGSIYADSITIAKTTILRAVAIEGGVSGAVATQSYLFVNDIIHQSNTPEGYPANWGPYTAVSGNAVADYEIDPEMVADPVFAETLKMALKDIPTVSLVTDKGYLFSDEINEETGGIYYYTGAPLTNTTYDTGRGWERPVSFEYFDAKDSLSAQVNCGISINGGHSRRPEKNNKHSFRLMFKSKYGASKFNYPLFGEAAANSFNSLILRAEFGNSWMHQNQAERVRGTYQRDTWGKDIQRNMGHPSSQAQFAHLYLNGIYWGMYVIAERMDKDFAASYMSGSDEDFDVIKDYSEAMDGTIEAWQELIDKVNAGVSDNESYQQLLGNYADGTPDFETMPLVDVNNLIDYMLINFYAGNSDWDHHNWAAMRNRIKRGTGFRFMVWDGEHLAKDLNENNLKEFNDGCPSNIFQKLLENSEFKNLFADRVNQHCINGILSPDSALSVWMKRYYEIEDAVNGEAARWGDYRRDVFSYYRGPYELYTKETHWLVEQDFMQNTFFEQRRDVFIGQLQNAGWYPTTKAATLSLNDVATSGADIVVGDVLKMSADQGLVYYTTNGSDPMGEAPATSSDTSLVAPASKKYVLVPTIDYGNNWRNTTYDESGWLTSEGVPGGVGYETKSGYESSISLDVSGYMSDDKTANANNSCYIRMPFELAETALSGINTLNLKMLYDDGFVAYLNGQEVARVNAPDAPLFNSASTDGHEADAYENFNLTDKLDLLKAGKNVLAVQGLNEKVTSSDFIINCSLVAGLRPEDQQEAEALVYNSPIILEQSTLIKARAFANNQWSPMTEAYFSLPQDLESLRITEIHYNPLPNDTIDGDKYEFLELKNTGNMVLDLGKVALSKGVDYTFASGVYLAPNAFVVLASDQEDFYERYGFMAFDNYKGQLDNNGERILLTSLTNDTISTVRYSDQLPWPELADAGGYSLVPTELNPVKEQDTSMYWRLSYDIGGSPGEDDIYNSVNVSDQKSAEVMLSNCYPNPFSDFTTIHIQLPVEADVQLRILDVMGKVVNELVTGNYPQGSAELVWDGRTSTGARVSPGVYLCQLIVTSSAEKKVITKKVVLVD